MTTTGDGTAPGARLAGHRAVRHPLWLTFVAGAAVGLLGGLVGLGGAEFRLPLLIALFGFVALQAVIVNKAMSLVVVLAALPSRLVAVPPDAVAAHWLVVLSLLLGSLPGAWVGAAWATRMRAATLYRVLAVLLVVIAAVFGAHHLGAIPLLNLPPAAQVAAGIIAGVGIGVVAAVMGVAGGELLIPTIVLLFAVNVKLAGSLSLLVSLPTMLVAFFRYSRDQAFGVLRQHAGFVVTMAAGSVAGSVAGGLLLGAVPEVVLVPLVVALLVISAVKVWQHRQLSTRRGGPTTRARRMGQVSPAHHRSRITDRSGDPPNASWAQPAPQLPAGAPGAVEALSGATYPRRQERGCTGGRLSAPPERHRSRFALRDRAAN